MADKQTYDVHRSMHGDGKDYERGDTRDLTEADAAAMVKTGALSLKGKKAADREPAVVHTFGTAKGDSPTDFTIATGEGIVTPTQQAKPAAKPAPAPKPAAKPAKQGG